MTYETTPPKSEKHFSTARTPKHNNRSGKKDAHEEDHGLVVGPTPGAHCQTPHQTPHHPRESQNSMQRYSESPRRLRAMSGGGRPPSPEYYYRRGYYDYYDYHRPPYERYDPRHPPPRHYYDERDRGEILGPSPPHHPIHGHPAHHGPATHIHPVHGHMTLPHGTEHPMTSSDASLRAVSSSFSANGSLIHANGNSMMQGGAKFSPGVVTTVDSLEAPTKSEDTPHPPSLSSKSTIQPSTTEQPQSSPQSDSSWKQLRQIASIDTKDVLQQAHSEETDESGKPKNEVVVPTPKEAPGLEKSISRTSSLSHSPTEEDLKFSNEGHTMAATSEYFPREYAPTEGRYHPPPKGYKPPPSSMPYPLPPGYDEISPSASTISTKDTRFFGMKPKHPVLLKGREAPDEAEAKRRKLDPKASKDEDSPANASFGDIGAMPSWDKSGWSVCSGMTGMESLMQKDLGGNGVLTAFSFSSEMSKRVKKDQGDAVPMEGEEDISPKSAKSKKKGHVHFTQSFDGQPHPQASSRKRTHDGRMPPPRYRRGPPPEEYPHYPAPNGHEYPPPSHPQYDYSPAPRFVRYPPREYEEDPYYDYGGYPRYYDYRGYRPPPPAYRPHEYEYPPQPPRGMPVPVSRPAPMHSASRAPTVSGIWDKEDDMALMNIMKSHKSVKNWDPIAKKLNRGKTGKECHDRWMRVLKPGSRKGQWTDTEDRIVFEAVTNSVEQPFTRWSDLAQQLPGRVGKQVRDRWVNHLNPSINHLPFSKEDDLKLWEGHCLLGKRWVEISAKYYNSTRSENHIKNRWYSATFKKFVTSEFGPDAYRIGNEQGGLGGDLPGFSAATGTLLNPLNSKDNCSTEAAVKAEPTATQV